jgi:hypothetical protein
VGCPRVERCTEIARNCTDPEKNNRPTIGEVVHDLDDLENMIQLSLIDQVTVALLVSVTTFVSIPFVSIYKMLLRVYFNTPNAYIDLGMEIVYTSSVIN